MLYSGKFWRGECLVNLLFSSASEVITVLMSSVQKLFCCTEKPIITQPSIKNNNFINN